MILNLVIQKLGDVMKLELLDGKSADEIGEIWRAFFINKDSLSAVIPADTYRQMEENLRQHCTVSNREVVGKFKRHSCYFLLWFQCLRGFHKTERSWVRF